MDSITVKFDTFAVYLKQAMKNSLFIVILLTFVFTGETIGSTLLYSKQEVCLVDNGADGETEKDVEEENIKNKLQMKLVIHSTVLDSCQKQIIDRIQTISQQDPREIVNPPPELH